MNPNSLANLDPQAGFKHGHSTKVRRSPTYTTWDAMKRRCLNPNSRDYKDYGGKGITIDPSWTEFKNFLADMGERPVGMTIDRKDGTKGYTKDNCRWATHTEQMRNKRTNVYFAIDNVKMLQTDWAIKQGLRLTTIKHRIRAGWSVKAAVLTPARPKKPNGSAKKGK